MRKKVMLGVEIIGLIFYFNRLDLLYIYCDVTTNDLFFFIIIVSRLSIFHYKKVINLYLFSTIYKITNLSYLTYHHHPRIDPFFSMLGGPVVLQRAFPTFLQPHPLALSPPLTTLLDRRWTEVPWLTSSSIEMSLRNIPCSFYLLKRVN